MSCDPKKLARMMRNRREHPGDYWTNQIIDATTRATERDALLWGFDPRWMAAERAEMAKSTAPARRRA